MKITEAKIELDNIMRQKTVSITRLKRVLSVLDYSELEKRYIEQGRKIKRQRARLRDLEESK